MSVKNIKFSKTEDFFISTLGNLFYLDVDLEILKKTTGVERFTTLHTWNLPIALNNLRISWNSWSYALGSASDAKTEKFETGFSR